MKKIIALLLIFSFVYVPFFSEDAEDNEHIPELYEKGEFPSFLVDLRRTEIVTVGSYPFTLMAFGTGYSLVRFFNNKMDMNYMPNPFSKSYSAASLSKDEQKMVMLGAAGISIGIGVADFLITKILQGLELKNTLEAEKKAAELDPDITIIPVYHNEEEK